MHVLVLGYDIKMKIILFRTSILLNFLTRDLYQRYSQISKTFGKKWLREEPLYSLPL